VESAFSFPSAASFPRPELRCGYRLMFIPFAMEQHCPGNACEFVGDGDDDLVARGSGFELMHPSCEAAGRGLCRLVRPAGLDVDELVRFSDRLRFS
jgi:hypothetical protein